MWLPSPDGETISAGRCQHCIPSGPERAISKQPATCLCSSRGSQAWPEPISGGDLRIRIASHFEPERASQAEAIFEKERPDLLISPYMLLSQSCLSRKPRDLLLSQGKERF